MIAPVVAAAAGLLAMAESAVDRPATGFPEWAYGTGKPSVTSKPAAEKHTAENAGPAHLPGSAVEFTKAQANDPFAPGDWYPTDHPAMPDIVAHGRKPNIWACALCHFPNGKGKAENAGVAGLPVSYFIQQMHDFRDGLRRSADERKKNTNLMIAYARTMTDEEIKAAADYFGAMPWTPWIRVVETATVPKTRLSVGLFIPLEGDEREPIGSRIIEVPQNPERTEIQRDPRSGFIAYVPPGSLKKGEALVKQGGARTEACGSCHGATLKGLGPVPGIAGRSPSYLTRQLYDLQQGTRKGEWGQLMGPVVEHLTEEDMLNIAAYTASLTP